MLRGRADEALALLQELSRQYPRNNDIDFLLGLLAVDARDYDRAIRHFRAILDREPKALRVRLELARALFLMKDDEQADYHFRLAIAEHPPKEVTDNIARFREAIRARRAWRFNINFGILPDSNINSATNKQQVTVLGLPFSLDEDARAKSGVGWIVGGDANVRLLRENPVALYLAAYGRMVNYPGGDFDDIYLGGEAGPEFRLWGGRLRTTATAFHRWYGGRDLDTSYGTRLNYDKVIGGKLGIEASLGLRRDDYARRRDLDSWNIEANFVANRALSATALGFGYANLRRSIATESGQSYWSTRIGAGIHKELGWGLRPELVLEAGRQVHDAPLPLFNETRRDWSFQAAVGVYKRDWNVMGFAPSVRLLWTRNQSTITLYDQKRLRVEFGIAKAF